MGYTTVGKSRLGAYVFIFLANAAVLALSGRVNQFQGFFYMADLFPFGLSITTLILFVLVFFIEFSLANSFLSRPPFEIGLLSLLSVFWLAFSAFSTARWRHIPVICSSIPSEYADEQAWCRDVQALKSLVWIEWVSLFLTLSITAFYVIRQHSKGHKHIWSTSLSHYRPNRYGSGHGYSTSVSGLERSSSFFVPDKNQRGRGGASRPGMGEIPRSLSTGVSVGGIGGASGPGMVVNEVGLGAPREMRVAYESAPTPNVFVSSYESTATQQPSVPTINPPASNDDAYAYANSYGFTNGGAYANEITSQTQTYTQAYQPHQTAPQTHRRNQSGMGSGANYAFAGNGNTLSQISSDDYRVQGNVAGVGVGLGFGTGIGGMEKDKGKLKDVNMKGAGRFMMVQ